MYRLTHWCGRAHTRTRLDGRARTRGQSLVEFALALPVLLIVLLFALDFGRAFYSWVILQNAARLGANFASLNPEAWQGSGDPDLQAEYAALISKDWGTLACDTPPVPVFTDALSDTSTAGQTPDTTYDVGDSVRVTLTCPFQPLTPIIAGVVGNTVQLSATSEFRIRAGSIAGLTFDAQIPKPSVAAPTPTPGPTPTAGPTPTPAPTPACLVVPDLTLDSASPETVSQARTEWTTAGFTGPFTPANGVPNKIVLTQNPPAGGSCVPANTPVTVTHS